MPDRFADLVYDLAGFAGDAGITIESFDRWKATRSDLTPEERARLTLAVASISLGPRPMGVTGREAAHA